jgi:phosphate transport system permease protein
MTLLSTEPADPIAPSLHAHKGRGDTISRLVTSAAGVFVLVLLAAIAVFLVVKALPAFEHDTTSFWTTKRWDPDNTHSFGIAAMAFGTVETAVIALVIAWPVAMAVALFVAEYAPRRIAKLMGYLLDLLAAVPSIVYGLWGLFWLVPRMKGLQGWLGHHLSWIPIFKDRYAGIPTRSPLVVGVVLAIMILPIISAIIREIVVQADPAHKEAALALGATHWEMIRMAVLPPSKSGIVGATILGLGRALGETIAVALILASSFVVNSHILEPGGNTIAGNIAVQFGEAGTIGRSALIASGLVLFAITLVVNFAARWVIGRSEKARTA